MNALLTKSALAVAVVLGSIGVASADDWKLGVKISAAQGGGVYVHEVFAGSPAELAGLVAGDIILSADGVLYNDPLDFRNVVMSGNAPSIDLIYQSGDQFYQVTAQFQVVTTFATVVEDGQKVQKQHKQLAVKKLNRAVVADPRKGAKPAEPKAKPPASGKKEVKDPRK